jgi:hypothetical protein
VFRGSYSSSINGGTAIRAGDFKTGSTLAIILTDGFDGQAAGGKGGTKIFDGDGENGGIVFDAQGVTTDIYFSGDTSAVSTAHPIADGYIRAPGGGGAGTGAFKETIFAGGGGGAGRMPGLGGIGNWSGTNGDVLGNGGAGASTPTKDAGDGGDWGQNGGDTVPATHTGGLAGSGIITGGGAVTIHGSTALRYINGNGSFP